MRLAALHIDGFGIFHNLDISGLLPGFNMFYGENESGKTTLLAFVRTILFGFPPGQRRENLYPPLAGGRHGGNLVLEDYQGERYIVARHHGRRRGPVTVTLPDGSQGEEELLSQLTGAASEDLFRSVFAFSLLELQHFDSLNKQAVKAAIYSAGAGVGRISLAQADKGLEASLGQLFKPGGKRPTINKLFRKLREIDLNIRQRTAEIERYDVLRDDLSQVAALVDTRREHLTVKRRRLERVKLLEQAWEDWVNLCRLRDELVTLPEIETFPADGIGRLEALQERDRLLNSQIGELSHAGEQVEKESRSLETKPQWLAAAEQIRLLERGLERFSASRQDLAELLPHLEQERHSLETEIKALGPDWRLENLDGFDTSISAREEIRRHQELLDQAREASGHAERGLAHAASSLEQAKVREREAEASLDQIPEPEEKDPEILRERLQQMRTLRTRIQSAGNLQTGVDHLRDRQEDLRKQEARLVEQREAIGSASIWPVAAVFLLSAAVALIAGWRAGLLAGLLVATGGLLLSLLFLWVLLIQRRRLITQGKQLQGQLREVQNGLSSLVTKQERLLDEMKANQQEIARQAKTAGLSEQPTLEELDRAGTRIEAEQEALRRWLQANQRCQEYRDETEQRRKELIEAENLLKVKNNDLQAVEELWRTWLRQAGLAESLSPSAGLEVMERVRAFRQQARSLAEKKQRQQVLEESGKTYQEEVQALAEQLKIGEAHQEDAVVLVHRLIAELERNEQDQRHREILERQLEDYQAQQEQKLSQIQEVQRELQDLFAGGGATEEGQFRQRAHFHELRLRTKSAVEQHLRSLENLGGRGDDQSRFQEELQQSAPERLRSEREELEGEVQSLETEVAALKERQGRLNERLEQLESTEELSVLRQQRNALLTELIDAAHSWSVLTLCRHFLRQARQVYEQERKQPVVRESEHFFRTITDERYQSIAAPHGEERIQVITVNGSRHDLDVLSRGTAEQLYLSLRFGYIREFARRARPLPVIMDDILVNFDPRRVRAAAGAMLDLATHNQILYFTCHPETVALLKEHDETLPVWRLEAGMCRREMQGR